MHSFRYTSILSEVSFIYRHPCRLLLLVFLTFIFHKVV